MKPRKSKAQLGMVGTSGGIPIKCWFHEGYMYFKSSKRGGSKLVLPIADVYLAVGGTLDKKLIT